MTSLGMFVIAQTSTSAQDQSSNFLVSPNIGLMIWTLLAFLLAMLVLRKYAHERGVPVYGFKARARKTQGDPKTQGES